MRARRSISILAIAVGAMTGSAVGVTAQEDGTPQLPVEFRGRIACGPEVRHGIDTSETLQVGEDEVPYSGSHGYAWQPSARMSDPRLEGTYSLSLEWDEYLLPGAPGSVRIGAATWRIDNDEGAWQGSLTNAFLSDGPEAAASTVLRGEGAYEGMSVLWEQRGNWDTCSWNVRGLITESGPPAAPEPFIPA